jgi:hypothetical protein
MGGLRGYGYGEHRALEQEGVIKINHHIWAGLAIPLLFCLFQDVSGNLGEKPKGKDLNRKSSVLE